MSKNTEKVNAKVILRKPAGSKDGQGWTGEVIYTDGRREFVPELFKEAWDETELAMAKIGNLVKAIADATNYALNKGYDVSGIIKKHGGNCLVRWDDYAKAVAARKEARNAVKGNTPDEKRAAWERVKGPYNSRVRTAVLQMELLTEAILAGEPRKALA